MNEHDEQVAVVNYLQMAYPKVLFWANPNGAHLAGNLRARAAQMNKLKAEGLLPGVSDLTVFEPRGGYSSLFIEMKRFGGGNGASENQLWFIREIEKRGAIGFIANGFEEAKQILDDYLSGKTIKDG